jgi:ribosomal protein S3AE
MVAKKTTEIEIPLLEISIKLEGNAEELEGKTIKMDLTRILKGKSIEVVFVVNSKELKAYPKKLILLPFYIRRIMKKGTDYVEDSFSCKSKDILLNIKTFFITRRKVSRGIRKALRERAREIITKFCEDKTMDEVISETISARLLKELSLNLKKIYPLAVCEIKEIVKKKQ